MKNGSRVDGVIESENKDSVQLNMGFGMMVFHRSEIASIERSDPAATQELWDSWSGEKKQQASLEPERERDRQAGLEEAARLREKNARKKKEREEGGPKVIDVIASNRQIVMNVLLNGKARVKLILDSGAGDVLLYKRAADLLGIDTQQLAKRMSVVADGSTAEAYLIVLDSVKVQNSQVTGVGDENSPGVEAKKVAGSVMMKEVALINGQPDGLYDGLLGMSFLKNFKFNADYENHQVTFERITPAGDPAAGKSEVL